MKFTALICASLAPIGALSATVRFYRDANYGDYMGIGNMGTPLKCYNLPFDKDERGRWKYNDQTTSIQIDNNVECRFWDSANCADQEYLTVRGWNPNVGDRWNDRISSFSCFA